MIDGLALTHGMSLLDVGTGDGLVAFRAIDRIGPSLNVVLTDVSADLIRHAPARAAAMNVEGQCRFIEGSAERLAGLDDASIDALAKRAVLAYVHDKRAALLEAHCVMKPGGMISLPEPLLHDESLNAIALRKVAESDNESEAHAAIRLLHRWKSAQYPDMMESLVANPLVNHSERDLLALSQECGYDDIHLELHISVRRFEGVPWRTLLASSPQPLAPTLDRILADRFDPVERLLRPSVEAGVDNAINRLV